MFRGESEIELGAYAGDDGSEEEDGAQELPLFSETRKKSRTISRETLGPIEHQIITQASKQRCAGGRVFPSGLTEAA